MTPEQKAEMEAYMKAGTPGSPHQGLAVVGRQLRSQDPELARTRGAADGRHGYGDPP